MMRTALLLTIVSALAGTASAQSWPAQSWSPNNGWDTDFEAQRRADREAFERRRAEIDRTFEEDRKRMTKEFDDRQTVGFLAFGSFAVAILIAGAFGARSKRRRRYQALASSEPIEAAPPQGSVDVSVLRIAIDGRASKFVRTELARIMSSIDGTTSQGRSKRLREVSVTLRRVRDSWIYGGAVNEPMRVAVDAKAAFAKHVDEARVRFTLDAVPTAKPGEPQTSLILVTIVVAARGELVTVSEIGAGEELRRALEAATHRAPDEIVAFEVVWVPEEDGQVLSSLQLEAQYPPPDLYRLRGAVVGNVYCNYCGGPFPAELVSCPHCGAPARGRDRDRQAIA